MTSIIFWQFWQNLMMKKIKSTSLNYPIVLRRVGNDIILSAPDLGHWTAVSLRESISANSATGELELTDELMQNLSKEIKHMLVYIDNHINKKKWIPEPSTFRQSVQKSEGEDFTLPEFTRQLQARMNISENTVRREIKRGAIQCYVTEGGHRRIPYAELEMYLERRKTPTQDLG